MNSFRCHRRSHLVENIVEGIGTVDGETDENKISLGVGQRTETVVFFLAGCVPKGKLYRLASWRMNWVRDVVLKYRRDVFLLRGNGSVSWPTLKEAQGEVPLESIPGCS
jgi:hypothetical protein